MRRYGFLFLTGLFFLLDCNSPDSPSEAAKNATQQPRDNYIVLLDLGNRILVNPRQQIPKDIDIVRSIYSIFKNKLAAKDPAKNYYGVTDKLKLLGAPNWFYTSIDLAAEQPDKRATIPDKMGETFNALVPEIYKGIIINTDEHWGSDIWKYFNEHLADDLDKTGQNTLFVVTDGYMDVKDPKENPAQKNRYASCTQIINALKDSANWEAKFTNEDYGLLPVGKKFSNLRVVVLQVNPKTGWSNEYSLLSKIWDKWFAEMGISNYSLVKNDSTAAAKEMLSKIMNVAIDTASSTQQWAQTASTDSVATSVSTQAKSVDQSKKSAAGTTEVPAVIAPARAVVPTAADNSKTAPAIAPQNENTASKTQSTRKKESSTPDVVPPDESDTHELGPKTSKKKNTKNDDDILQDDAAANGFNTGIKKDGKKKKDN